MNLFDNMHGLKGCIRCLTFKNVLLAHFLLAFSVAGSVSAEALPTSYLNGIEQQSRKVAGRVLQRVDNEPVIGANIVVTGTTNRYNYRCGGTFLIGQLAGKCPYAYRIFCWHDFANASDQIRDDDTSGG